LLYSIDKLRLEQDGEFMMMVQQNMAKAMQIAQGSGMGDMGGMMMR